MVPTNLPMFPISPFAAPSFPQVFPQTGLIPQSFTPGFPGLNIGHPIPQFLPVQNPYIHGYPNVMQQSPWHQSPWQPSWQVPFGVPAATPFAPVVPTPYTTPQGASCQV